MGPTQGCKMKAFSEMRSESSKKIPLNRKNYVGHFLRNTLRFLHLFIMHSLKILLLLQLLTETEEWQSVLEAARERGARLVVMCWGPAEVCAAMCHSWQPTQGDRVCCIARGDEQMRRSVRKTSTLLLSICSSLLTWYRLRSLSPAPFFLRL